MSQPRPILLLSDHPNSPSGLARITRDLATRIATKMPDKFKVATISPSGVASSHLPFFQYTVSSEGWAMPELPQVWRDHCGAQDGVLLTIWDLSRLAWLIDPQLAPTQELANFIAHQPMKKWAYCPIDAEGVDGKLSFGLARVAEKFDRLLAYTRFGADVIDNTFSPKIPTAHIPHGIDIKEFSPVTRAREQFSSLLNVIIPDDCLLMGVVATNQARKEWPIAFEVLSQLKKEGVDVRMWIHTDTFNRYWDIGGMVKDFDVEGLVIPTMGRMTVDQLACGYSACDITLGIGSEGFGYPLAESLACGTPCITGDYAGGAEIIPDMWRVPVDAWRYDGGFNSKRPVYLATDWITKVKEAWGKKGKLPSRFDWDELWPEWERWLIEGAAK